MNRAILYAALVWAGAGFAGCGAASSGYPPEWVGHEYEVIKLDDISSGTRDRLRVRILAPTADSPEDRVATAMDAALHFYTTTGSDLVTVWLVRFPSGPTTVLATADYAPDGCGVSGSGNHCTGLIWTNLQASVWTNEQLEFKDTWQRHLEDFKEEIGDGDAWSSVNKERLHKFLAERFNTTPADIREMLSLPVTLQTVELP